jgi:hypothetical protein
MPDINVFRPAYRELSELEKEHVARIKTIAGHLHAELTVDGRGAREMALAKTNLEQAVMWAVKAITG